MKTSRMQDSWQEHSPRRMFTLEQADASLVLVRRIVGDIVRQYQQVLDCQEIQESCHRLGMSEGAEQAQRDLLDNVEKLQKCAEELVEIGVELKDWALGVVDFPSLLDGREIRLCWQYGEESVRYWHQMDAECSRRQQAYLLADAIRA